jgi:hypothetical protein
MLCSNCKHELASGDKFCPNCGTRAPQEAGIAVKQAIGTVAGAVTGVAAGQAALPAGVSLTTEQTVDTVAAGGAMAGVVLGGAAPVHVGGQQHYGDAVQGDKVMGDKVAGDKRSVGDSTGSTGVAIGRGASSTVRNVNAGSGDYAEGDIDKRKGIFGGEFSGPAVGTIAGGTVTMGDQTSISGVTGSNVNVGSTLSNVSQRVGAMAHGDAATKAELQRLIAELQAALQRVPVAHKDGADEVARRAEAAVAEAAQPKPDKEDVEYGLSRLQKAAENIKPVLPTVFSIALKIAETVGKLVL